MFDRLFGIASAARRFMEPVWNGWHRNDRRKPPSIPSRFTCGRTSEFLRRTLCGEGLDAEWANGIPRLSDDGPEIGPYGFLASGRWESHTWAEVEGWIVDITADQFGAAPVIVVPSTDSRYGKRTMDTASPEFVTRRNGQVDEIWPLWVEARRRESGASSMDAS